MKKLLLLLALALLLASNAFAEKKDKSKEFLTLNEAVESGECYVACENGEASLYKGNKKVDFGFCLEMRKHKPFNCSDSERSEFRLKLEKYFGSFNKRSEHEKRKQKNGK
jgi:hypothetical protein